MLLTRLKRSLPTGERGLKYFNITPSLLKTESLPTGERGLKCQKGKIAELALGSLPTGERGLKLLFLAECDYTYARRSLLGSVD